MAVELPGYLSKDSTSEDVSTELWCSKSQWYFSRQELEFHSPSRKMALNSRGSPDCVRCTAHLSKSSEWILQCKPQVTIATSMMLCHRFYTRQSHAKNDWQTVAAACLFLACKTKETPGRLSDVTVVAYKLMYKWDPSALRRIKQKDVYEKQTELMIVGERVLLTTISFDLNIELPYKPLVTALKRLEISDKQLLKVAWNYVNDWICTPLCLQYKSHYIAAESLFLAARSQQMKLPKVVGRVWWMQFDVAPKQLEEVTQEMLRYIYKKQKQARPLIPAKVIKLKPTVLESPPTKIPQRITKCFSILDQQHSETSNTSQSCVDMSAPSNSSVSGSASSPVDDGDNQPNQQGESDLLIEVGNNKIDVNRIREAMERRRLDKSVNKIVKEFDDGVDSESWIEMELEKGIELNVLNANKRIKVCRCFYESHNKPKKRLVQVCRCCYESHASDSQLAQTQETLF